MYYFLTKIDDDTINNKYKIRRRKHIDDDFLI